MADEVCGVGDRLLGKPQPNPTKPPVPLIIDLCHRGTCGEGSWDTGIQLSDGTRYVLTP